MSKRLVATGDQHGILQVDPQIEPGYGAAINKLLMAIHIRGQLLSRQTSADGRCTICTYLLDDQDKYIVSYLDSQAKSIARSGQEDVPIEAFMEPQLQAINEVLDAAGVPEAPADTDMRVLHRVKHLLGETPCQS